MNKQNFKYKFIKRFFVVCAFLVCSLMFGGYTIRAPQTQDGLKLVKTSDVVHFFTHSLISFPEVAFAKNNSMRYNFDTDCITPNEFKSILSSLYERGYALVDIYSIFSIKNGVACNKQFYFPKDKKPIVLSFDDINYYKRNKGLGLCDKLVEEDGEILSYSESASMSYSNENEGMPIVEEFIKKNPDFSYCGARGILNLTGFDGILGYRTNLSNPNNAQERKEVKNVIKALKDKNWRFACHSYGHYHMKKITDERFIRDTQKWINEVQPLVGETPLYVYPYGEYELEKDAKISAKQKSLKQQGFKVFFGVGGTPYINYEPRSVAKDERCLLIDRLPLDGNNLRRLSGKYSKYFDCEKIYDKRRPKKFI